MPFLTGLKASPQAGLKIGAKFDHPQRLFLVKKPAFYIGTIFWVWMSDPLFPNATR